MRTRRFVPIAAGVLIVVAATVALGVPPSAEPRPKPTPA